MPRAASAGKVPDDLTKITGIGDKRRAALARLGIKTFTKLGHANATKLATALRVSVSLAERFIADAAERAAPREVAANEAGPMEPPESLLEDWTSLPAFSLWFVYGESDRGERRWRTIVYDEGGAGEWVRMEGIQSWMAWIQERAGVAGAGAPSTGATLPAAADVAEPEPPKEPGAATVGPAAEAVGIPGAPERGTARDLEIVSVTSSRRVGLPAKLDTRVEFHVHPELGTLARRHELSYLVRVEALSDEGTAHSVGASFGRFEVDRDRYTVDCVGTMPPAGQYRLRGSVQLQSMAQRAQMDGPGLIVA
jgi:hypothetical protein